MQCKSLQIFWLYAAIQFQFTVGYPNGSPPTRHICTIATEHNDCQFHNVHLKQGQSIAFGLEYNPQKNLTFEDSTLDYLPKSLIDAFPNVTHLNLNALMITSIEQNAFEKAANLQTIYLEANSLINIDHAAFSGANKLQVLVLSGNKITFFDYYSFNSNTDLRYLYLDLNQLDALPKFTYNTKLKLLNASHNNLESINDYHFRNQRNLKTLDVLFNRLKRLNLQHLDADLDLVDVSSNVLSGFTMPTHVNHLNARNNSLTGFVVSEQCTLETLILAQNKLQTQPMLDNCSSLEYLDLSYNLLEAFSYQKSMVNVQYLKLAHNFLFEIYLPIEIPSKPFSLKVLDLSYNMLSYGPALNLFKNLEWASFNDNYLISLMSYLDTSQRNFKGYRMANNEWSCDEVQKFEHLTHDKNKKPCADKIQNVSGICCRTFSKPYNDRLNQLLWEVDFHERSNKQKCSNTVSTISDQSNLEDIRNAIANTANANTDRAEKLKDIETVRIKVFNNENKLKSLQDKLIHLHDSKRNVAREIERQRQFHRVTREGLITDKEMLGRLVKFVQEIDAGNEDFLSRRKKDTMDSNRLFDEKQQEIIELQKNIAYLQATHTALKKAEKDKKKEKDQLQRHINKNSASIHGGTGKI